MILSLHWIKVQLCFEFRFVLSLVFFKVNIGFKLEWGSIKFELFKIKYEKEKK